MLPSRQPVSSPVRTAGQGRDKPYGILYAKGASVIRTRDGRRERAAAPGGLLAGPGRLVPAARDGALRVAVIRGVEGDQREPQRYGGQGTGCEDSAALHGGLVERHPVTC